MTYFWEIIPRSIVSVYFTCDGQQSTSFAISDYESLREAKQCGEHLSRIF